ncbi:SagB family peptide dehydrogenase [Azohydromonas australica]|uniref:SagB family peptide dehydrogenase n=1 Tax=Azohydromonas australica TaxID=364039 RepID=UPI001EE40DF9|nr:SagB family peptide dehydrogenase [Azohydromonas australica]
MTATVPSLEPLADAAAVPPPLPASPEGRVRAYHQRTKHHLQRYAAGPETLDWDAQPDPFRRWRGAPLERLPLPATALVRSGAPAWADLFNPGAVAPHPADRNAIGLLLELSFALAAWKQHGPDRWAVRVNPSSGNLHPTEAYLLAHGVNGLADGLYHYAPREHALERRAALAPGCTDQGVRLWVGLASIYWREAWKYGERAYRYCQLDAGHALGALRYAAAVLGWRARVVQGLGDDVLCALLGLDRAEDFGDAEREVPDCLVELLPDPAAPHDAASVLPRWIAEGSWRGSANRLDRHPMYRWPVIEDVAAAARRPVLQAEAPAQPGLAAPTATPVPVAAVPPSRRGAVELIRGRRSAQRFDRRATLPRAALERIVQALMPGALPWDALPGAVRVHPVLFAHRVDGLAPGAYLLPRSAPGETLLREALGPNMDWLPVEGLPLWRLAENPALAGTLRTIDCHQALGSDAALAFALLAEFDQTLHDAPLAFALLAEFDQTLHDAPWRYRELLVEAGLLGQVLYLEAEAAGFNGTGIGCYFDDSLHELLGIEGTQVQSVYHFTIGAGLHDPRIQSMAPYAGREEHAWTTDPSSV